MIPDNHSLQGGCVIQDNEAASSYVREASARSRAIRSGSFWMTGQ
jgi:hypothetical protein